MMMVRELITVLPDRYFAIPGVHLGTVFEVDVGTYGEVPAETEAREFDDAGGGVAGYAPPQPTLTLQPQLRDQDVYEVRVYDNRRNRQLVAAIEIGSRRVVSPAGHRTTAPHASDLAEFEAGRVVESGVVLRRNVPHTPHSLMNCHRMSKSGRLSLV